MRLWVRPDRRSRARSPQIFHGPMKASPDAPEAWGAFPAVWPSLRANRFQGRSVYRHCSIRLATDASTNACTTVKKKREPSSGPPPASPGSFALPPGGVPRPGSGILTWFPFAGRCDPPFREGGGTDRHRLNDNLTASPCQHRLARMIARLRRALPHRLGSTNPCPTAVHMEPFSTSAFKAPVWIFATTTKIRTGARSTRAHPRGFVTEPHAPLLVGFQFDKHRRRRSGIGGRASAPSIFGAGPFGRWVVTHSLADFDFHDHRPAVRMDRHPLWGPHGRALWHFNPTFGSSRIASSAYQKWPTRDFPFAMAAQSNRARHEDRSLKRACPSYPFKVWE